MQTDHPSNPVIARPRPSYGPLVFGSLFLWGGVSGILHDTTTMGLGPSLTIALSATGLAVFVVILIPRLTSPGAETQTGSLSVSDEGSLSGAPRYPGSVSSDSGLADSGLSDPEPTADTKQMASQEDLDLANEFALTDEANETAELAPTNTTSHTKASDLKAAPWDSEKDWATDIRW